MDSEGRRAARRVEAAVTYDPDADPRYAELMAAYVRAELNERDADAAWMPLHVPTYGPEYRAWQVAHGARLTAQDALLAEYPHALDA